MKKFALASLFIGGVCLGGQSLCANIPAPGDGCSVDGAIRFTATASTPGYLLACNGSSWAALLSYNESGGNIGISNSGATCAAGIKGAFRYNTTTNYMEYCNGSLWRPFDSAGCTGPASCPAVGNSCADGSIFAGCNPASFKQLFVTACDAGQTASGSSCSGGRLTKAWNNGNIAGYTMTGATSLVDGSANSAILVAADADSVSAGVQIHQAATYCHGLTAGGHADWYLPAEMEIELIYVNRAAIGNFAAANYQSSTEAAGSSTNSVAQAFDTTALAQLLSKSVAINVRCMRSS